MTGGSRAGERDERGGCGLPRVVIVGGGFGGLYAALGLARAPVTVTVIDKHNYHLFRPIVTHLVPPVMEFRTENKEKEQ